MENPELTYEQALELMIKNKKKSKTDKSNKKNKDRFVDRVQNAEKLNIRVRRPVVLSTFEEVSDEILVVPGKSSSVKKLYEDFVMGRLDASQIGGDPMYDKPDSTEVDPFNTFGLSLEQVDALRQENERTIAQERKKGNRKTVANASTGTKLDEPQAPPSGSEPGSE